MTVIPFRGLADKGILRDPSPYQLDTNAWSGGSGVRFHGNKVMRAPVFRTVVDGINASGSSVGFCAAHRPATGRDRVIYATDGGKVFSYASGASTDVTPTTGYTPTSDQRTWTAAFMGDVTYLNRPSGVPLYYGPSSTLFATLPHWDSTWRCRSLRAFGSYLVAMNVTKGTSTIKNLVKWSDLTLAGLVPGSWDATDPTTNSGENVLQDLDTPLVDGLALRTGFVLYAADQIWAMEPVSGQLVFNFRRLFAEGGMIAPNCGVEVGGRHYVFGPDDIYVHDGTQKQSLIDKRNREAVYRSINMANSEACFAFYMPRYNEIMFAYPTGDSTSAFTGGTKCNRAAIYNIPGDTWSFIDLPNVSAACIANVDRVLTYASSAPTTYAQAGGSYFDQEQGLATAVLLAGASLGSRLTDSRIYGYDFASKGSLSFPISTEASAACYIERTGIDLDQVGGDLVTYKNVRRIFPLVRTFATYAPVIIQVGSSMTPTGPIVWGPQISFDPATQYKVDMVRGGRYLALRFSVSVLADFELDGFDLDVVSAGRR